MIYHKIKFTGRGNNLKRNFKVLLCRIFGHRLNENPSFDWCERCNLCYSEAYKPVDWFYMQGITDDTTYRVPKEDCNHPMNAMLLYNGEGHGKDECTLCGTREEDLQATF